MTPQQAPAGRKYRRIVGAERHKLAVDFVDRYLRGESIRALATSSDWSYGFVHRVLTEAGVRFRRRGGQRLRRVPQSSRQP